MNRIILLLALGFLVASIYFFFYQRDLFSGSITILLCILFNLIFAMMNNMNKTGEKK